MIVDQKVLKQIVGVYLIDKDIKGTQLATTEKPNFFRILIVRLFLGWKWVCITTLKKKEVKFKAKEDKILAKKEGKTHIKKIIKKQ